MDTTQDFTLLTHRKTQAQKDAKDKEWYKQYIRMLSANTISFSGFADVSDRKRKKVNYDLFNGIVDQKEFEDVCRPYGPIDDVKVSAPNIIHHDIISGKIKVLLGMEMKRPFGFRVVAVNDDATTRKEQEQFGRIKEFVRNQIMQPLDAQVEAKYQEQTKGKQLSPEEMEKMQADMAQEKQAQTPDEVLKYMKREHQDPAETLGNQIMDYLLEKERLKFKFNKAFKHGMISADEVMWVGIVNNEPVVRVVNSLNFEYDRSADIDFVEDGDWAKEDIDMTLSQILSSFGDELTDEEIEELSEGYGYRGEQLRDADFTFTNDVVSHNHIRVSHYEWKSERKVGFLLYRDGNDEIQEDLVPEGYTFNKDRGDIELTWEWIPEKHEGYMIGTDKFVRMRPVPGQHRDLDNLYECKLSYIGGTYDSLNSEPTSPIDRIKSYQYLYDIILFRIKMLIASDRGKKVLIDIDMLPDDINTAQWMYFFDNNPVGFINHAKEGNRPRGDVSTSAKEIDLSMASRIDYYINLAEFVATKCGQSIGISGAMEAQAGANDPVTNTQQNLVQASHILEPYYDFHNHIKRNTLQALIEVAKVAYSENKPKKLAYMLDDLSNQLLDLDSKLLENSTYGIFVSNSTKANETKQVIEQLAHAAMQNAMIDMSAVIKVMNADSAQEAEELFEVAEDKKAAQNQAQQMQQIEAQNAEAEKARAFEREKWDEVKAEIILKEEERRKTVVQTQAMESLGFSPDKDADRDGTPDVLEVAKFGVEADIKNREVALEERKTDLQEKEFNQQTKMDAHQREVDKEKLKIDDKKASQKPRSK